jgi:ATP-binding cassette, subfamily B, multidrug efflux pump
VEVFKQLRSFYWPERKLMFASIFCLMLTTALGLVYPNLLRYLIDEVIAKRRFEVVPMLSLLVIGVVSIKAMFQFLHGFSGGRLGNKVAFSLRNALYNKLQYLS